MKLLMAAEDTTVLMVYPSLFDEYRQPLRTFGGSDPGARHAAPEADAAESGPAEAAYVVTTAGQRHLWGLPDPAVSGRRVVDEARALELLRDADADADWRPWAVNALFPPGPAAPPRPASRRPPAPRRCRGSTPCGVP